MSTAVRCVAFRSCRRKAKYTHPHYLCSKHRRMWWDYGVKGKRMMAFERVTLASSLDRLVRFVAAMPKGWQL